jgi:hypothetical protein
MSVQNFLLLGPSLGQKLDQSVGFRGAMLTFRAKTITSCSPFSLKASTIVLPTFPVPPTTATTTIVDLFGGLLGVEKMFES